MITFEKIRDMERIEKTEKPLQQLPENFLSSVQEYLSKKIKTSDNIIEMDNIKNTIKRLWEIRERKILEKALASARTGIEPKNMNKNEKQLFETVKKEIVNFHKSLFTAFEHKPEQKLFLVKQDIPEFIGPDMKTYKLKKGQKLKLPEKVTELLLKQNKIEKV